MEGVGLPGHFIVSARVGGQPVLLDPFHGGAVLTPEAAADVAARAVGRPVKLEEAHWTPTTKRQIVVRMLRNLKTIYARQSDWGRALCVIDRLLLVDAETPMHVRDRGTVLVKAGRLWEGVVEWERYLGAQPPRRTPRRSGKSCVACGRSWAPATRFRPGALPAPACRVF